MEIQSSGSTPEYPQLGQKTKTSSDKPHTPQEETVDSLASKKLSTVSQASTYIPLSYDFAGQTEKPYWLERGVVKPISMLSYLGLAGAAKLSKFIETKIPEYLFTEQNIKTASDIIQDVVHTHADQTMHVQDTVLSGGKTLISGIGTVIDVAGGSGVGTAIASGANTALSYANEASKLNVQVTKMHFSFLRNVLSNAAPLLASGIAKICKVVGSSGNYIFDYLAQGAWNTFEDPTLFRYGMLHTAQRAQGVALDTQQKIGNLFWNIASDADFQKTQKSTKKKEFEKGPQIHYEDFKKLSKEEQLRIIWISQNSPQFEVKLQQQDSENELVKKWQEANTISTTALSSAEIKTYEDKNANIEELSRSIKDIIQRYNDLPAGAKLGISPADFHGMLPNDKLQMIHIVEKEFIVSPNDTVNNNHLTELQKYYNSNGQASLQEVTIKFLLKAFNSLPAELKAKMFDLTPHSIVQWDINEQKAICDQLTLKQLPEKDQKKLIPLLKKFENSTPLHEEECKTLCKIANKSFSFEEKLLIKQLQLQQIAVAEISQSNIEETIQRIEDSLASKEQNIEAPESMSIQESEEIFSLVKSLVILKQQSTAVETTSATTTKKEVNKSPVIEQLDLPHIHNLIGAEVRTKGMIEKGADAIGHIPNYAFWGVGKVLSKGCEIGASEKNPLTHPKFIERLMFCTALALDSVEISQAMLNASLFAASYCLPEGAFKAFSDTTLAINSFFLTEIPKMEHNFLNLADKLRTAEKSLWDNTLGQLAKNLTDYTSIKEAVDAKVKFLFENTPSTAEISENYKASVALLETQLSTTFESHFNTQIKYIWETWGSFQDAIPKPEYNEWFKENIPHIMQQFQSAHPDLLPNTPEFSTALAKAVSQSMHTHFNSLVTGIHSKLSKWHQVLKIFSSMPQNPADLTIPVQDLIKNCTDLQQLQSLQGQLQNWDTSFARFLTEYFPGSTPLVTELHKFHTIAHESVSSAINAADAGVSIAQTSAAIHEQQAQYVLGGASSLADTVHKKANEASDYVEQKQKELSQTPLGDNVATQYLMGGISSLMKSLSMGLKVAGATADIAAGRFAIKLYCRTLSRVLRATAPTIAQDTRPLFTTLAGAFDTAGSGIGNFAQESIGFLGESAQLGVNALASRWYEYSSTRPSIDTLRLENFITKLTEHEQKHLAELVIVTPELVSEKEYALVASFLSGKIEKEDLQTAVKSILYVYDIVKAHDLTLLTPTQFLQLDNEQKDAVLNALKRTNLLGATEKKELNEKLKSQSFTTHDVTLICQQFSKLHENLRFQALALTSSQFFSLPERERDNILFLVESSPLYWEMTKKIQPKAHADIPHLWLENHSTKMTRSKLSKMLACYSRLNPQDLKSKLLPSQLLDLGYDKMRHIYDTLRTYGKLPSSTQVHNTTHQTLLNTLEAMFIKTDTNKVDLKEKPNKELTGRELYLEKQSDKKLVEIASLLCVLYNENMDRIQKKHLLTIDSTEFLHMPKHERAHLVLYMQDKMQKLGFNLENSTLLTLIENPENDKQGAIEKLCNTFTNLPEPEKIHYHQQQDSRRNVEKELDHYIRDQKSRLDLTNFNLKNINENFEVNSKQERALEETISRLRDTLQLLTEESSTSISEINKAQDALDTALIKLSKLQTRIQILERKAKNLEAKKDRYAATIQSLEEKKQATLTPKTIIDTITKNTKKQEKKQEALDTKTELTLTLPERMQLESIKTVLSCVQTTEEKKSILTNMKEKAQTALQKEKPESTAMLQNTIRFASMLLEDIAQESKALPDIEIAQQKEKENQIEAASLPFATLDDKEFNDFTYKNEQLNSDSVSAKAQKEGINTLQEHTVTAIDTSEASKTSKKGWTHYLALPFVATFKAIRNIWRKVFSSSTKQEAKLRPVSATIIHPEVDMKNPDATKAKTTTEKTYCCCFPWFRRQRKQKTR